LRALFVVAIVALGLASLSEAGAADVPTGGSTNYTRYSTTGVRAAPLVIYDYQPGVYVRDYWRAPWRNRHYYPFTGKRPGIGRYERLSATRPAPKPAETFYREWSTISLFPPERWRNAEPEPRTSPPPQYPAPLK
jgi:hypothetical protein